MTAMIDPTHETDQLDRRTSGSEPGTSATAASLAAVILAAGSSSRFGRSKQLIELENRGQNGVEELRQETVRHLKNVDGGRKVQQAYGRAPKQSPLYLDRSH